MNMYWLTYVSNLLFAFLLSARAFQTDSALDLILMFHEALRSRCRLEIY